MIAVALAVALGFGLRLASALDPVEDPGTDSVAYERIAEGLYESGRYGSAKMRSPSDWSPGAPLLFATVYYVTGGVNPEAARIAVALLGAALVLVVYLIGRRLAGPAAGVAAAFLAAIYPTFIENTGQLLTEPVAALTLASGILAFLWAADRERLAAWLVPGALLGATALTRPEYLVFGAVVAALAFARVAWTRSPARPTGSPARPAGSPARRAGSPARPWRGIAAAAVLAAGFVIPLAPWTARNYVVLGHFVPVTTGGGKALFVATYLPGNGRQVPTKRDLLYRHQDWRLEQYRHDPLVRRDELRATEMNWLLNRVASRYPDLGRDEALARIGRQNFRKYVREQPLAYLRMTAAKTWNIWRRGSSPAMRDVPWLVVHRGIVVLGLVGLGVLAWRRRFEALLLGAVIGGITLLGSLLLGVPRRNVPLMPLVMALAATGGTWLVLQAGGWLAGRRWRAGASAAARAPAARGLDRPAP